MDSAHGTLDHQVSEAAVSYDETWMKDTLARHGLALEREVAYGSWSGRDNTMSFQDLIVVRRDGAHA